MFCIIIIIILFLLDPYGHVLPIVAEESSMPVWYLHHPTVSGWGNVSRGAVLISLDASQSLSQLNGTHGEWPQESRRGWVNTSTSVCLAFLNQSINQSIYQSV